jgi:putative N6-adenine-specific DNA methylase
LSLQRAQIRWCGDALSLAANKDLPEMTPLTLIATTAFGLEAVVARELKALGYTDLTVEDGRIVFPGDHNAICRCNLWLRSAERVLVRVGEFPAADFDSFFDQTTALPWAEFLPVDARFPVDGKSVRSMLHHTPTIQAMAKRAIAENLKKTYQRHWFQETGAEFPIEVSILKDRVTFSIDTSGDGLHKRGYREIAGPAPLRETVAAALVQLSFWNPERYFLDPFCGSGTIAIEAALIGRNRAPGLQRDFLAEQWPWLPRTCWKEAREEAKSLQRTGAMQPLAASDIDRRAIKLAITHAEAAGVAGDITFSKLDFLEFQSTREYGVIVCNPPYGERMGDWESAEATYDDMADVCENLPTWSVYVLTSHEGFERLFRRRADRRRKLYNGRIECTYYQFFGPKPGRPADADDQAIEPPPPPPPVEPPPPRFQSSPRPAGGTFRPAQSGRRPAPTGQGGPPRHQGNRPPQGGGNRGPATGNRPPGPPGARRPGPPRPAGEGSTGYRPRRPPGPYQAEGEGTGDRPRRKYVPQGDRPPVGGGQGGLPPRRKQVKRTEGGPPGPRPFGPRKKVTKRPPRRPPPDGDQQS